MSDIKDSEIYPKFEFRLSHKEKDWLLNELEFLKSKFHSADATIAKNDLVMAALRHGFRYLRERELLCAENKTQP